MPLLRNHPDELQALVARTAEALAIEQIFVEKDFWVVEVLRAATAPGVEVIARDGNSHRVRTIFKGGTTLSRVYSLTDRFSEDVDLLAVFPDSSCSTNARDKVLKAIRDNVATHLGLPAERIVAEASTTGVKRNVRYHYAATRSAGAVVTDGVLLELGSRGGSYPTQQHALLSLVAEFAIAHFGDTTDTWDEFEPVAVEVLGPERTLVEKLSLLHDGSARAPEPKALHALRRAGRHLYDVHQLLSSDRIVAALNELGQHGVAALSVDIDHHSAAAGFSYSPRPQGGYGQSPLLDPDAPGRAALRDSYQAAMSLVYGSQPSFEECIAKIQSHASML